MERLEPDQTAACRLNNWYMLDDIQNEAIQPPTEHLPTTDRNGSYKKGLGVVQQSMS